MNSEIFFIRKAIEDAKKAEKENEVPVGCVIVKGDKILARAHNQTLRRNDPTAHAEILAIRKAAAKSENCRLTGCSMYVTIEPCPMCAGAAVWSRIKKIIYGAPDKKTGACGSVVNIAHNKRFNHIVGIRSCVLRKECAGMMQKFFRGKR